MMSKSIILAASLLLPIPICAAPDLPPMLGQWAGVIAQACPVLIKDLTGNRDIQAAFAGRAVDSQSVCSCAFDRIVGDSRLVAEFRVENAVLAQRLNAGGLKAYATLRGITSILACLSTDVDKSLAAMRIDDEYVPRVQLIEASSQPQFENVDESAFKALMARNGSSTPASLAGSMRTVSADVLRQTGQPCGRIRVLDLSRVEEDVPDKSLGADKEVKLTWRVNACGRELTTEESFTQMSREWTDSMLKPK